MRKGASTTLDSRRESAINRAVDHALQQVERLLKDARRRFAAENVDRASAINNTLQVRTLPQLRSRLTGWLRAETGSAAPGAGDAVP